MTSVRTDSGEVSCSRVAAVISPCSMHVVTLKIRKFNSRHFTVEDLINSGSLNSSIAERLKTHVENRRNRYGQDNALERLENIHFK